MTKYIVETDRLILRPPTLDDVDDYAAKISADPDVMRYLPKRDMTPRERAERGVRLLNKSWDEYSYGGWVIVKKSDGQLIGSCDILYLNDTDGVELGYDIAKAQWGQGIATEAARACVRFGFETAKLNRIMAVVVPENTASWRALERIGFIFEKKTVYFDLDVVCYAIRPEQFHYGNSFYQVRMA